MQPVHPHHATYHRLMTDPKPFTVEGQHPKLQAWLSVEKANTAYILLVDTSRQKPIVWCRIDPAKAEGYLQKELTRISTGYHWTDQRNKERRERRKEYDARKDYKPGDLLQSSWGYDQTNVDFYKVKSVTKARVKAVKIGKKYHSGCGPDNSMAGYVSPDPDAETGKEIVMCATPDGVKYDRHFCYRTAVDKKHYESSYH